MIRLFEVEVKTMVHFSRSRSREEQYWPPGKSALELAHTQLKPKSIFFMGKAAY